MAGLAIPDLDIDQLTDAETAPPVGWQTVVWNDPVNLMSYVVHVFRTYFGFEPDVAHRLMLAVHHDGHAVVSRGPREVMEAHTQAMHEFGLWATVRQDAP